MKREKANMSVLDSALDMLQNRAMARKLKAGKAVDISTFPREGKYYVLDAYADDIDYCDMNDEAWVWSIGRRHSDGKILASLRGDLYQNPAFECLWLR